MKSRILIYNLETAQSQAIARELSALAADDTIAISTAHSVAAVRLQTSRLCPSLFIAPLTSDGLALAHRLYERSATMQVLFLYGPGVTSNTIEAVHNLGWVALSSTTDLAQIARRAGVLLGLYEAEPCLDRHDETPRSVATLGDVQLLLDGLRRQTHAQLVLYTDHIGNLVIQRGDAGDLDLVALTSLIAGGFGNSLELGRALHDTETRHLNVLEGQIYDVYATNAGNDRLLALVFAKKFVEVKLGYVWLLLKRCAAQLSEIHLAEGTLGDLLCVELGASLNSEFDRLFGDHLKQAL